MKLTAGAFRMCSPRGQRNTPTCESRPRRTVDCPSVATIGKAACARAKEGTKDAKVGKREGRQTREEKEKKVDTLGSSQRAQPQRQGKEEHRRARLGRSAEGMEGGQKKNALAVRLAVAAAVRV